MQQRFLLRILLLAQHVSGHHYAHHQELKSIIQWLLPVVFRAVIFKLLVWCGADVYVPGLQDAAGICAGWCEDVDELSRSRDRRGNSRVVTRILASHSDCAACTCVCVCTCHWWLFELKLVCVCVYFINDALMF